MLDLAREKQNRDISDDDRLAERTPHVGVFSGHNKKQFA